MTNIKFKNLIISTKEHLVASLFSFNIFFWGITLNFIQLRFLIFLLVFPIFFNFNRMLISKLFKYFLFSLLLFLHLFYQANTLLLEHLFAIFGLFLIFIILDIYKDFFLKNLNKIIIFFLITFYLFILIQFFSFDNYFKQVSDSCVGCFSILRVFYKENSHLALIAPPVIFYLLSISTYNKFINYFILIVFLFICFVNPSLTLYVGLTILLSLVFFFKIKLFKKQYIILAFIFIFILFKFFTDSVAKTKVNDFFNKNNNINLSTEVYKISFLVAKNALFHKPLGYRIHNYFEAFDKFIGNLKINNKDVSFLNKKDISFVFFTLELKKKLINPLKFTTL